MFDFAQNFIKFSQNFVEISKIGDFCVKNIRFWRFFASKTFVFDVFCVNRRKWMSTIRALVHFKISPNYSIVLSDMLLISIELKEMCSRLLLSFPKQCSFLLLYSGNKLIFSIVRSKKFHISSIVLRNFAHFGYSLLTSYYLVFCFLYAISTLK